MIRCVCFILKLLALIWGVSQGYALEAGDWPIYRGNGALQGLAEGELHLPLNNAWSVDFPAGSMSSPIVCGNSVVIGCDDGVLYALHAPDGQQLWSYDSGAPIESPPLYHAGSILFGTQDGTLYRLDAKQGREIWHFKTEGKIIGSANISHADPSSPRVVFGSHDSFLYCLDFLSGKLIWKYQSENFINGTPACGGNIIAFGGCDARLHILNESDGSLIQAVDLGSYIAGSVALDPPRAYLGHYGHRFVCVDVEKKRIEWEYHQLEFPFFSSPAIHQGLVVFGGRDRMLHAVDQLTGESRWVYRHRGKFDASPVICGDKVVAVATDGLLGVFDLSTGEELWSTTLTGPTSASPAVSDGWVFVVTENGKFSAFQSSAAPVP